MYSNSKIGFGRYKNFSVEELYCGTRSIQKQVFCWALQNIFNSVAKPDLFSCNHLQYFVPELLFGNIDYIDKSLIEKSMANRFLLCERRSRKNWFSDFAKYSLGGAGILDFSDDLDSLDDAENLREMVRFSPYELMLRGRFTG